MWEGWHVASLVRLLKVAHPTFTAAARYSPVAILGFEGAREEQVVHPLNTFEDPRLPHQWLSLRK